MGVLFIPKENALGLLRLLQELAHERRDVCVAWLECAALEEAVFSLCLTFEDGVEATVVFLKIRPTSDTTPCSGVRSKETSPLLGRQQQ